MTDEHTIKEKILANFAFASEHYDPERDIVAQSELADMPESVRNKAIKASEATKAENLLALDIVRAKLDAPNKSSLIDSMFTEAVFIGKTGQHFNGREVFALASQKSICDLMDHMPPDADAETRHGIATMILGGVADHLRSSRAHKIS